MCRLGFCVLVCFNTQPPEGGWNSSQLSGSPMASFNTQPPEGGWILSYSKVQSFGRFNTQPPEGGWNARAVERTAKRGFNTQPPEGGWMPTENPPVMVDVSTHSRPKAAGFMTSYRACKSVTVSTHSRPKAAGTETMNSIPRPRSFNTQPPEGGWRVCVTENFVMFGFNTQPPEGGWVNLSSDTLLIPVFQHTAARRRLAIAFALRRWSSRFQHTAARRRLDDKTTKSTLGKYVSTHSRPKAAGDHTEHHQQ